MNNVILAGVEFQRDQPENEKLLQKERKRYILVLGSYESRYGVCVGKKEKMFQILEAQDFCMP